MATISYQPEADVRGERFVGFYWTLPIPLVGFVELPRKIEAAVKKSRTINYQRKVVHEYANLTGHIVDEYHFLEIRSDRGTEHIKPELEKALNSAAKHSASLLYVAFWEKSKARAHPFMMDLINDNNGSVKCIPLPPARLEDPLAFDPIEHFRTSRENQPHAWSLDRRLSTIAAVKAALRTVDVVHGASEKAVIVLNEMGITTLNGRAWKPRNLRAFIKTEGITLDAD